MGYEQLTQKAMMSCLMLDITNYIGTIPAHSTGWCGAAFPTDSARLSEAEQTGQALCHF